METTLDESGNAIVDGDSMQITGDECRICLKKCLNGRCYLLPNDKDVTQKLIALATVQVEEGDGLPATICLSCERLLDISYDFKCQIQKADEKLRKFLQLKMINDNSSKQISLVESVITDIITNVATDRSNCQNTSNTPASPDSTGGIETGQKLETRNIEQNETLCHIDQIDQTDCNIWNDSNKNREFSFEKQNLETSSEMSISQISMLTESIIEDKFMIKEEQFLTRSRAPIDVNLVSTVDPLDSAIKAEDNSNLTVNLFTNDIQRENTIEENTFNEKSMNQNLNNNVDSLIMRNSPQKDLSLNSESLNPTLEPTKNKAELRYVCHICDKQFSNIEKLKNHIHHIHESSKKRCKKKISKRIHSRNTRMNKILDSEEDTNERSSKKDFKFSCKVCSKQFIYQKSFLTHAKTHEEYTLEIMNNEINSIEKIDETVKEAEDSSINKTNDSEDDDEDNSDLPTESLQCTQCGKLFATKRNLKRHISTHSGLKFNCSTCGKGFSRIDKLKDHEQSKHKDEIFGCSEDDDDDETDNENKLIENNSENRKKEKHSRPHKCALCTKAFAQAQSLSNHMERHKRVKDTQKRFLCEVCSKCFAQSGSLVAHMRTHTGVKPYVCNVCSRAFTKSTYLQLHLRTHSGEKPYICQYCSRAFARANTLARHITMHTGEAKYHCQICKKSFRRLTSLNEHTYTHTGQRPYACKICTKRYNNAGSLYAHTKKCKAQQLSTPNTFAVTMDNSAQQNGNVLPQVLIYSQRKLVEDSTVSQVTPTSQYMLANIHNQKPLSTNIIQPFTVEDPNLYNVNTKTLKNPYYAIYP